MRASTSPSDNVYKSTAIPSAVWPKACLVTLVFPCIVAVSIIKVTRIANQALTLSGSISPLVFLLVFVSARYCTGPAYWHVERGGGTMAQYNCTQWICPPWPPIAFVCSPSVYWPVWRFWNFRCGAQFANWETTVEILMTLFHRTNKPVHGFPVVILMILWSSKTFG